MATLLQRFGYRLSHLRQLAGKTQEQLEHEGAAHRTYVSELERGEKDPSLSKIVALAKALGVAPAALVDLEQDENSPGEWLATLFTNAIREVREPLGEKSTLPPIRPFDSVLAAQRVLESSGTDRAAVLAEMARIAGRQGKRDFRDSLEYIVADKRSQSMLRYTPLGAPEAFLDVKLVLTAVKETNRVLELLHDMAVANGVPLFALLGMRNLSSFVGEAFKSELCKVSGSRFAPNPNQDGYPDLCALTSEGVEYFATRLKNGEVTDKSFWSPFPFGGVEVKATCGNTPSAKLVAKPQIGESRWPLLQSAEWKAHHRKTNNLIGLYWDFVDGLPAVLAVFFRNDLTTDDWGEVIKPSSDSSSTTSVSIMPRGKVGQEVGVRKMARGWLVLPANLEIRTALTKSTVFHIPPNELSTSTSQPVDQ